SIPRQIIDETIDVKFRTPLTRPAGQPTRAPQFFFEIAQLLLSAGKFSLGGLLVSLSSGKIGANLHLACVDALTKQLRLEIVELQVHETGLVCATLEILA